MSFARDGFLILRDALDRNKLADLREAVHAGLDSALELPGALLETEVQDHQRVYEAGIAAGSSSAAYELLGKSNLGALGANLLSVKRSAVHFLPLVVSVQIPQNDKFDYRWHQESAYYPWCPSVLSVWFPILDPSTKQGGTMAVVPGSHTDGPRTKSVYEDSAAFEQVEVSLKRNELLVGIPVEIGLGDAIVFDSNLVHASLPNRGTRPRVTGILRIIEQNSLGYKPLVKAAYR